MHDSSELQILKKKDYYYSNCSQHLSTEETDISKLVTDKNKSGKKASDELFNNVIYSLELESNKSPMNLREQFEFL